MVSTIQPASPILKLKSNKLCSDDPDFQQMDEVLFASSPSDPFRECCSAFCFGPWLWFGDDRSMSEFMTMGSLDVGHLIFFIPTAPSCHKNSICVFMFGPAS